VISSSQRPLPHNTQQSQQTKFHAPGGFRTHDLSRQAAADLLLRPRGFWDRRLGILIVCLCMATLTEVFPCFILSCKANARIKPAKTGHSPHSSKYLCCSVYFCVVLCIFVLFYVFLCCSMYFRVVLCIFVLFYVFLFCPIIFVLFCVFFVLCR